MAKKSMTIEEVKKAKIALEKEIMDKMKSFEEGTGVYVGYINVQREREEKEYLEPEMPSKKGPIKNVEVNMDLDLIY
jgi:hypothetical protein